jgi:hypothetical protein
LSFKNHLYESQLAKQESINLERWKTILEAATVASLKVMRFVNSLTKEEALFIYEAYQGGPSINKDVVLFPQDWKKGKQRKFAPWEKEHASDQARQAFSRYAEPRRAIMDVAKELAKSQGKPWQDVLDEIPINLVYDLLVKRGGVPEGTDKNYMKSQLKKMRDAIKAGKVTEFDPAMGVHLRQVLKSQEPIIQAWKDLGFTTDYKDIVDHLKEQGYEFPTTYLRQANIDFIKSIKEKVKTGDALNPDEQEVYKAWVDLASKSPMRKTDDPFKAVGPEDVYRVTGNLLSQHQVEEQLVKKVLYDLAYRKAYEEDPKVAPETIARKFQRAAQRFAKGEGSVKGMQQVVGTDEPSPDPYIAMDYHGTQRVRNQKIYNSYFDKSGHPNEKFYTDIVKPACMQTNKVVALAMRRKGFEPGSMKLDFEDKKGFCGFDQPGNDRSAEMRVDFLGGATMQDLVQTVILKLLNSTNLPKWDTEEGIRMRTAEVQAAKLVLDLLTKRAQAWRLQTMSRQEFVDQLSRDIKAKGQEEEAPEEQLFDPETLQQIIDNPEALQRMKDVVANAPEDQKDYYQKLLGAIEKKIAELK